MYNPMKNEVPTLGTFIQRLFHRKNFIGFHLINNISTKLIRQKYNCTQLNSELPKITFFK